METARGTGNGLIQNMISRPEQSKSSRSFKSTRGHPIMNTTDFRKLTPPPPTHTKYRLQHKLYSMTLYPTKLLRQLDGNVALATSDSREYGAMH
jgi:hypothetical protein